MSTLPAGTDLGRLRRARAARRAFFVLLTVVLLAGMAGLLGVSTTEVATQGAGYELSVRYARTSRPGLATPWSVEIRHPGGFPSDTLQVASTAEYFDIFDENGFEPEPVESVSDGESTIWTFRTPSGSDTLSISLDARIEPAVQFKTAKARTAILQDGEPVATVSYSTFILP